MKMLKWKNKNKYSAIIFEKQTRNERSLYGF